MTDDEKPTTTVPKKVVQEMERLSKQAGITMEETVEMYKKVFAQDYLSSMAEEQRHGYALMILQGELHGKLISNARVFELQLIDKSSVKHIKKDKDSFLLANLYVRLRPKEAKKPEEEEWAFGEITMWRDATGLMKTAERGKWYEGAFNGSQKDGLWKLNSDDSTTLTPIKQVNGAIPMNNFIDSIYERVPLAEFDDNLSKGKLSTPDYKLAVGFVQSQRRGYKEDRDYGVYTITDESLDLDRAKEGDEAHKGFTVWTTAEQAIYKKGSILQVISRFEKNDKDERSIRGICINPIAAQGIDDSPLGGGEAAAGVGGTGPGPSTSQKNIDLDDL